MTEELEYGPWIEHDGKGAPVALILAMCDKGWAYVRRAFTEEGRKNTPAEQAEPSSWDPEHPGWTWKRSGWFGTGGWVASDPAYARILKYRFARPRPPAKSVQVEVLKSIAADPKQPISEPEKQDAAND